MAARRSTRRLSGRARTVAGPASFRDALLVQSEEEIVRTVAEKLLTFALRRGLTHFDAPTVRAIVRDAARDDYRWSSLVLGVVASAPFQQQIVPEPTALNEGD